MKKNYSVSELKQLQQRAVEGDAQAQELWGMAFGNDPHRTAINFRQALENDFCGAFSDVVFAITDWSEERKYLGPFRDVFNDLISE